MLNSFVHCSKILNEYQYRLLKQSDHWAITELCHDIYGGNDFLPYNFHRYLSNNKCICAGIEYLPNKQIVGTRILKIIDGGVTALGIGARMHYKHRGKKIFSSFRQWNNKFAKKLYPNIQRIRGATYRSNVVSLHIASKEGQIIIQNLSTFYWAHIEYTIKQNSQFHGEHVITPKQMQQLLLNTNILTNNNLNQQQYKVIQDINKIIYILKDILYKKTLYIDLQIYDLSIGQQSIFDIEQFMQQELESNRLKIWINDQQTTMGMVYNDERPYLTQLYIYGDKQYGMDALLMMNYLFFEWKNNIEKLENKYKHSCWIFIDDQVVDNYCKLDTLCEGFDTVAFTQMEI